MTTVEILAAAKVNLTLHVTGQRADGYHLLDSLVAFARIGDRVRVRPAPETRLTVTGPFSASVPTGPDNLVLRAAALLGVTAEIALEKTLPVASGLGGGSADAAATLKALSKLANVPLPDAPAQLSLGADVPVCVMGGLVRMRGIGERLVPVGAGISWPMVLVNPGVPVSTPGVFSRLAVKDNPPMPDTLCDAMDDGFPDWLAAQRNDLEAPAIALAPEIGAVLDALRDAPGCRIARMSGSGASCFALFDEDAQAAETVLRLRDDHPDWWVSVGDPSDWDARAVLGRG